jgi:hypothetical protein
MFGMKVNIALAMKPNNFRLIPEPLSAEPNFPKPGALDKVAGPPDAAFEGMPFFDKLSNWRWRLRVGLVIVALWLACIDCLTVLAQAPDNPAFEVASVRSNKSTAQALDWPPVLRQTVKTQNPSNGELSHGSNTQAVHAGV